VFLWSGATNICGIDLRRAYISPQILAQMNHATPKMNNWHAGSAVAAVLAALKLPLQKKKYRYSPSSGWSRGNYSISLK
jgi:hypothetical protein